MLEPGPIPAVGPICSGSALVHPLDQFYAQAGKPLPPLDVIEGEAVPEPYRRLLVHQADMTPTLEKFHGILLHLRVIGSRRQGAEYFREVTLLRDDNNQPVEFGAIKISLHLFPASAQAEILQEHQPLGHILESCRIQHTSRPSAFFRIASDRLINELLQLSGAQVLYGRRNTLFDPHQRALAEIVEILPVAAGRENALR